MNYWQDLESIINYELALGVNCKNVVATDEILKAIEEKKIKDEADRIAK